ncbi:MAG: AMP-binding protein, partial [Pseudomonadales bacterium]
MRDYFTAAREFDYASAASSTLAGDLDALNACVECCDRHAQPGRVALLWEGRNGERAEWTFAALKDAA